MDPFLQFLTWQFVLFCMFVLAITQVIRNVVEFCIKNATKEKVWTTLILPMLPLFLGAILGFGLKGPYPDGITIRDSQIVFGTVAGMFSTILYRVIKGMLKARLGNEPEDTSNDDLLNSIRNSINTPLEGTTITTTTTTSVPVVDGQPIVPVAPTVPAVVVAGSSEQNKS